MSVKYEISKSIFESALLKLGRIFAYTKYTSQNIFEMVKSFQNLRF